MTLKATLFAAVACLAATAAGAREARDFFVEAPPQVVPMLETNARLDMIDYFATGLSTPSANTLNGRSRITALSPDAIEVQMSRDATLQMVVVPSGSDTTIVVIETVLTPVADSSVSLYRASDWKRLPSPALPGAKAFIAPDKAKEARGMELPDMTFTSCSYMPAEGIFRFTDNTAAYYTTTDSPEVLKMFRTYVDMRLKGRKFTEVK